MIGHSSSRISLPCGSDLEYALNVVMIDLSCAIFSFKRRRTSLRLDVRDGRGIPGSTSLCLLLVMSFQGR